MQSSHVAILAEAERIAVAGSFECDLATQQVRCSIGLHRILASPPAREISGDTLLSLIEPADRETLKRALRRAADAGAPFSLELRAARFDGAPRTLRARGITLQAPGGGAGKLIGTIQDVTDEARARSARELLGYVVDSSEDAILTVTPDGTIRSWNRAAERLYGYSAEEAIATALSRLEPASRAGEHREALLRVFAGQTVEHLESECVRKDGTLIGVSLSVSPVRDRTGTVIAAAVSAQHTADRAGYELRLQHLAAHDELTGLFNRRRFDEELRRELARAGRTDTEGALLVLDVDRFRAINDASGHIAGDAVLRHLASVLRGRLRATEVIGRLGGDELAALLPGAGAEEARKAAEDLREAVRASRPVVDAKPLAITTSVGVAPFYGGDTTPDELLIHADLAMAAAKSGGGDRVVLYSPQEARIARSMARETWSERIREALERDSFELHLQPIIDLSTGLVSHGELLLRMRDRQGQLIAPGEFLPTAERVGLIHQIDRWVVKRAIELIASRPAEALPPVSVNLSGDTVVGDAQMLALIERELARHAADPSRLIFEVTETVAIANMLDALSFTRALIGMGCSLALDDFGTGFASFKYLKHLPVRFVKLDGEFIQNLPRSPIDEHVVRTIVGLARSLGIKTVAEAVTDDETIDLLRAHEVDFAQGFHLGPPEPLPEPSLS